MNIIIEFRLFKLALVPNFSLNWQFWFFWPDLSKKDFSSLKQKKWTSHIFYIILHNSTSHIFYILKLVQCENSAQTDNFYFLDQICTKRYFQSKTEKVNIIVEFCIFKLVSWYQISALTVLIFWPGLSKKSFSGLKQKKWRPHIFHIILHILISLVRIFSSNWQFWFFWTKFAQKGNSSRKQKKWTSPLNSAYFN